MTVQEIVDRTKQFLLTRSTAYKLTFGKRSPAGQVVLRDLMKFCKANETTWSDDARHHARLEGRREVLLRIQQHMNLTSEELFLIYNGHSLPPTEG